MRKMLRRPARRDPSSTLAVLGIPFSASYSDYPMSKSAQ